jgi:hypothetical protein
MRQAPVRQVPVRQVPVRQVPGHPPREREGQEARGEGRETRRGPDRNAAGEGAVACRHGDHGLREEEGVGAEVAPRRMLEECQPRHCQDRGGGEYRKPRPVRGGQQQRPARQEGRDRRPWLRGREARQSRREPRPAGGPADPTRRPISIESSAAARASRRPRAGSGTASRTRSVPGRPSCGEAGRRHGGSRGRAVQGGVPARSGASKARGGRAVALAQAVQVPHPWRPEPASLVQASPVRAARRPRQLPRATPGRRAALRRDHGKRRRDDDGERGGGPGR